MDSDLVRIGPRAVVSLFAAVTADGLDAAPILRLAEGAAALELVDLGPALGAAGFAYSSPRARHQAARLIGALAAGFAGPITAGPPQLPSPLPEAEAAGVAPLPALVVHGEGGRRLSRAVLLGVPPDLLAATRVSLLGHGHLPGWLALAEADRTAIAAALPHAGSLGHAAGLAGRLPAIARLNEERRAEADAFIFGEPLPPAFLPEAIAAALAPGADGVAIGAMAQAVAPFLAAPPFCPAPFAQLPARRRRAPAAPPPASLPLFPEATAEPGLRAVS